MKKLILIPILLPTFILKSNGDTNSTGTDIFVKFNHAEASYEPVTTTKQPDTTTTEPTTTTSELPPIEDVPDTIVFVPNDRPVQNDEHDYPDSNNLRIKDIMLMKTVGDTIDNNVHMDTEAPPEDIVFISGKNTEFVEEPFRKKKKEDGTRRSGKETQTPENKEKIKLDCKNLECNNTIRSLCGGKIEHKMWRYRLFLNECYFRKVNCNFRYEVNRFTLVPKEKCSNMGLHEMPFSFKPKPQPFNDEKIEKIEKIDDNPRRSSSSRRSLTMDMNGHFCSHPCPVSCPNDYDPECAVSGTGQRRVFVNHCKLDFNSCSYGVVWHSRPLAECVGGRKADMRQNRGFIGWMQRVGIVDKKGRLSLN